MLAITQNAAKRETKPEAIGVLDSVAFQLRGDLMGRGTGRVAIGVTFALAIGLAAVSPSASALTRAPVSVYCLYSNSGAGLAYVPVGTTMICTASVAGTAPTGTIAWTANGTGRFSYTNGTGEYSSISCALYPVDLFGECSVFYTPMTYPPSRVNITGTYSGDSNNGGNWGAFTMKVVPANESTSSVSSGLTSTPAPGTQTVTTTENHTVTLQGQQEGFLTLSLAVVVAGAIIAIGIVLSARVRRSPA